MAAVSSRGAAWSRRELAILLLAGATGAGVVLLATRQSLARVVVLAPAPLPASVTEVTGQDLRPAIGALAVAALASLAAVLATRGLLRRITGLVTAALGAGIVALAVGPVSDAGAVAAAGRSGGSVGGFGVHVLLEGSLWRATMVCGALLLAGTGIVITVRATRLPAMSGRYDRPAGPASPGAVAGRGQRTSTGSGMWESLSAGEDPTVWPE